jgi:hypothetical protein
MTWQDISTAPKDGTPIVLYSPDAAEPKIYIGCWADDEVFDDHPFAINWYDAWTGEEIDVEPTHWLALPPTPETQSQGAN